MFAKLFNTQAGQILVRLYLDEERYPCQIGVEYTFDVFFNNENQLFTTFWWYGDEVTSEHIVEVKKQRAIQEFERCTEQSSMFVAQNYIQNVNNMNGCLAVPTKYCELNYESVKQCFE